MAVVDYVNVANQTFTVTAMAASDSSKPIFMNGGVGLLLTISAADGGGSGFNSGTLTVQTSNDNTVWGTLKDVHGTDGAFTADALQEFSTGAQYIRVLADGSIANVDVIFSFG